MCVLWKACNEVQGCTPIQDPPRRGLVEEGQRCSDDRLQERCVHLLRRDQASLGEGEGPQLQHTVQSACASAAAWWPSNGTASEEQCTRLCSCF